jgi:hypothetical protein
MAIITRTTAKTLLQISDTTKDALIDALIPQVEGDFLLIRNKAFDEDSNDVTEYPDNAELVAALMIGFHINQLKNVGMDAESLGDYSYAKTNQAQFGSFGYPKSITSMIKKYIGVQ